MEFKPINFKEKLSKFSDHWSPKIIAQMNDYHFKLVKFQGDFICITMMIPMKFLWSLKEKCRLNSAMERSN